MARKRGHGSKKRGARGSGKNNANKIAKSQRWYTYRNSGSAMLRIKNTAVTISVPYPKEFISGRISQAWVRETIAMRYLGNLANLPRLPDNETLFLKAPIPKRLAVPHHPPYVGIRVDNALGHTCEQFIIKKFDRLQAVRLPHLLRQDYQRSSKPAWHLAIWSITARKPRLTAESRNHNPKVAAAVDAFLAAVKKHIAPLINNLLWTYAPCTWKRHQRAAARVRQLLRKQLGARPAFDMGGAFFTIAVKEGSSDIIHIDFNDDPNSLTWTIPLGDWEGAELYCPQLQCKIPIKSGQIYGGLMRRTAHCSGPIRSGRRIVLTCFSDQWVLHHGDKWKG